MSTEKNHHGHCFCGAIELVVHGEPAAMGYCHCTSCREWSASPVNAFTLWPPSAITITRGAEHLVSFQKTENSVRKWCRLCGGHVLTHHPNFGLTDVYAATIAEFPFRAMLHVNYESSVLKSHDGLPKLRDFPKEMGGSGATLPE